MDAKRWSIATMAEERTMERVTKKQATLGWQGVVKESKLLIMVLMLACPRFVAAYTVIKTTDGAGGKSGQVQYDSSSAFGGVSWHVKNGGLTSYTRKAYLRFDTSSLGPVVDSAMLELTVDTIEAVIAGNDQTLYVYGITNQVLDAVELVDSLLWVDAPANDPTSPFAADLSQAELLGTFVLDYNGDKAAPVGTVVRLNGPKLVDFLNADNNGVVTLILGRTGNSDEKNLLFAGDTHATYEPPTLRINYAPAVVNTGSYWSITDQSSYTNSFNAGKADKLIVSVHHESSSSITSITYNGVPLTMIPGSLVDKRANGIWYLDDPYTSGLADVVVTLSSAGTHMWMGIASVSGTAKGFSDLATASASSVTLNVSTEGSLVFAAFGVNGPSSSVLPKAPLTAITMSGSDSMAAGAGYRELVATGNNTYSCTGSGTAYYSVAASFARRPPAGTFISFQ